MKKFAMTPETFQKIATYLVQRPYAEVAGLLGDIQRGTTEIDVKEPKPKKPTPAPEPTGELPEA